MEAIHSITIYKTDEGYRLRLEGTGLGRAAAAGKLVPDSRALITEIKRLLLNMEIQELVNVGGRAVSEEEGRQLMEAQKRLSTTMNARDAVTRDEPVPSSEFGSAYENTLAYLRKRRSKVGVVKTPVNQTDDDKPPYLRVVED